MNFNDWSAGRKDDKTYRCWIWNLKVPNKIKKALREIEAKGRKKENTYERAQMAALAMNNSKQLKELWKEQDILKNKK